jgi:predicted nucleic acid-binding protein
MKDTAFIDTNVLLDYVQNREENSDRAERIFDLCQKSKIRGFISALTLADAFYICRKDYPSTEERRDIFLAFAKFLKIVDLTRDIVMNALENKDFPDFEDCLQAECAKYAGAEYIVTRNVKDYVGADIAAITPEEFLKNYAE